MNLVTPENSQVILDADQPEAAWAPARVERTIERLTDLVDLGLTTRDNLVRMLGAARAATEDALGRPGRAVFVPGTRRPDLQRYSGYLSRLGGEDSVEHRTVWSALRAVNVGTLTRLKIEDALRLSDWVYKGFFFSDVTVSAGSTLVIAPSTKVLHAKHIVIHKSGRLVVQGASLAIKATSIQGL